MSARLAPGLIAVLTFGLAFLYLPIFVPHRLFVQRFGVGHRLGRVFRGMVRQATA